ncbi:tRNA (guanine-N7-)-methyltransferase [Anaeroplasma bactoclasticum]|jgi:tRNA (guanine-N7-)-methyltransferase|uniref:tRNA (guanine-N(7)-)-methyltransferase n=1 Tax=Anaeroplasma bactoclasticum TaxID=2088 RepID=A0A397S4W6_9MOLU|nr:tRNA (guanosine(46)-N7)-methyltransferase TrmB [Anaeroplasma bactoclasticum]RIA77751.1 tRNA (guanine-N7-)-methyltransferase [Anaeroplasma bactoclasticum]
MRLRKVKNARERLAQNNNTYYIEDAKIYKGKWQSLFKNENPLYIEIGCGKGQFIMELAKRNPNINYVALEKFDSVLLRALEKAILDDIPNLKLAVIDAESITEYFDKGEVSKIYLNFSDPWPKKCHAKRRLTFKTFLDQYRIILKEDGNIEQKTDNRHFFEFSLESFNDNGWKLHDICLDLHNETEKYPDNITTEFEDKWSKLGPIYRLVAEKK